MKFKCSEEEFRNCVRESRSWKETIRRLGWNEGTFRRVKYMAQKLNVDTTHFTGLAWAKDTIVKTSEPEIFVENATRKTSHIREYILRRNIIEYKCSECKLNKWNGKILSLELDHINGINNDHRLENLRWLCPNCHSLTPTWKGRKENGCKKHNSIRKLIESYVQ